MVLLEDNKMSPYYFESALSRPASDLMLETLYMKSLNVSLPLVSKKINRESNVVLSSEAHFELNAGMDFIKFFNPSRHINWATFG